MHRGRSGWRSGSKHTESWMPALLPPGGNAAMMGQLASMLLSTAGASHQSEQAAKVQAPYPIMWQCKVFRAI